MGPHPRRPRGLRPEAPLCGLDPDALRVLQVEGTPTISSHRLAERFGLNSAQIRKDLAQLGELGVRGLGYRVPLLSDHLRRRLGLDRTNGVVIVGAGNLGQALADSKNFNSDGFHVVGLFDDDRRKIGGKTRTGIPILDAGGLRDTVLPLGARIGVIAVPGDESQRVALALVQAGLRALLNFVPTTVGPFPGTIVKNADLTLFLESLSCQLEGAGDGSRPVGAS